MKTFTKFLTMLAVAALFATGCVNEEPPYKEDPNPEPAGTTGYLSIGNLSMTVVYDETEIRPDDTSDETQAARTASGTRATAPDVDSFIVEILDADNAQVLEMTYAQLKEQLKTPMELKVGAYRMEVRSEDTMPGVDWEHPVYGATSDFTITKAQTTSPEEVVCTLQNIKVSVEYSSELADMLADTSKATVSLGDTSLAFPKTETRAAYFKPQALENTLDFVFDGTFADTDVPAKFSKQITGVKAGQWRKVSVVIGYADKGNILFSVKVDNSILQDNKFVVDGTENLGEELLEDPNAAGESFWSSGNNTMTKTLCTSTDVKFGKSAPAAKLTSTNMLVLAAGNLFTGEFAYKSFTGTVQFGQTYAFTARPSAMKVKYHAHVGTVDKVRTSGDICPYIKKGDPDMARIFVAIVDWNAPHEVVSGMTTTKGAWDPEKGIDNVSEGKILGYGSLWITQSTDGEDMQDAELDIVWYDHETRPAEGKYSLVISCACNAYGDYFTGCSKNVMYVDDFEWVY